MNRYFWAVFVEDEGIRNALDAIRYISNPDAKYSAHITVKGPTNTYSEPDVAEYEAEQFQISVVGVGRFFNKNQNTVYLHCGFPAMRRFWDKKDFPGGIPHITIYDGVSREFAEEIYRLLRKDRFLFNCRGSFVRTLSSESKQSNFDLMLNVNLSYVKDCTGVELTLSRIRDLEQGERVRLVKQIWSCFVENTNNYNNE